MENHHRLSYKGKGSTFFWLEFKNLFFILFTLGLYYPWAKASRLRFHYAHTHIQEDAFQFMGTGQEMFIGFLKAIGLIIGFEACLLYGLFTEDQDLIFLGLGILYIGLVFIIPLAMHGTMRYRSAKSMFRGIRFGYRGNLKEVIGMFVKNILLIIFTLGIYSPWAYVEIRKYFIGNLKYGSAKFNFDGQGKHLFIIYLKAVFLVPLTLGIYLLWFYKNLFHFAVKHTTIENKGELARFETNFDLADVLLIYVLNAILVPLTLGLGYPWAKVATMEVVINSMRFGALDLNAITQTEKGDSDASGDALGDAMDLGFM
ncbi:MAG: uncharacterized membrane protein YjgN (DUF898 family) [Sphingobacteriales bacterium]|jgi:uncharacterized membrane protein YjgN (DUF898 family)